MFFSFIICLFLISRSKNLNRMLVICVLYFAICWNLLVALLCSFKSTSSPYTNPGVWNLRVCLLELVPKKPRLMCEIQISPNIFVPVAELGLEGSIPSLSYGIGIDCCTYGRSNFKSCIYSFLSYQAWNFGSLLGHFWCSCPFDFFSCFRENCGLG